MATLTSGLPSTVHALVTGGDVTEPTRAAAAMLIRADSPLPHLVAAAAVAHSAISLFWAAILTYTLPWRYTVAWAVGAAATIALLDLRVIAPFMFAEVARLPFWPQFADHLMWGASLGATLTWRRGARGRRAPSAA
ncbi:MAG: hypothetical protein ACT4P4_19500 [Betaproteobacteria bacterium]